MININKSIVASLALFVGLGIASCVKVSPVDVDDQAQAELLKRDRQKWADEEAALAKNKADSAARAEENKRLRELYLEDLRAYKKSEHMIMFGWFAYWNPESPDHTFSLDHLPDSVDFISNWGGQWNLDPVRKEQFARLKEKGTRMTAGWIVEHVGDGIHGSVPAGGWDKDPMKAIEQYARMICDSIEKYNYDGIDIDYEPEFASPWKKDKCNTRHCGDWCEEGVNGKIPIISCDRTANKERENHFFRKMREFLPKHKMLNINGSIGWIDPEVMDQFNYFVFQSYNNTAASRWASVADSWIRRGKAKANQFIYTESFQTNPGNANNFVNNYAKQVKDKLKGRVGGIGAFHINEDYLYGPNYKNVRAAIAEMNPPFVNK